MTTLQQGRQVVPKAFTGKVNYEPLQKLIDVRKNIPNAFTGVPSDETVIKLGQSLKKVINSSDDSFIGTFTTRTVKSSVKVRLHPEGAVVDIWDKKGPDSRLLLFS